jgi:hypothetical protein
MSATATASAAFNINAETNPFPVVQYLLDQAAYFSMMSTPGAASGAAILSGGETIGFEIAEELLRFSIEMERPSADRGVRARNTAGQRIARFTHRWLFAPDDFDAHPGQEPPPTTFDPSRAQRFVMLDSVCAFGGGRDGFAGFGTGHTLPLTAGGRSLLLAGAVGAVMTGQGRFVGLDGVYTYCGSIAEERGFRGSLVLRMVDPDGRLHGRRSFAGMVAVPNPDPDFSYIAFRSIKPDDSWETTLNYGSDGTPLGLHLEPQLRTYNMDCGMTPHGPKSEATIGTVIGSMTADIVFNPLNPGGPGTNLAPIPFSNFDVYRFNAEGGALIGSIGGNGSEGRTFLMSLPAPNQRAVRFGGFGPLQNGFGALEGAVGMMAHNSAVGIAPHALATLFVCRIYDPAGRYRVS